MPASRRKPVGAIVLGLAAIGAVHAPDASAYEFRGPAIRVNESVLSSQNRPIVDVGLDGGSAFSWTNGIVAGTPGGLDGSGAGCYLRRFDADGSAASGDVLVPEQTMGDQMARDVAVGADGACMVLWVDWGPGDGAEHRVASHVRS